MFRAHFIWLQNKAQRVEPNNGVDNPIIGLDPLSPGLMWSNWQRDIGDLVYFQSGQVSKFSLLYLLRVEREFCADIPARSTTFRTGSATIARGS